jgi:deoxyxylulose-5-phosphate synthase
MLQRLFVVTHAEARAAIGEAQVMAIVRHNDQAGIAAVELLGDGSAVAEPGEAWELLEHLGLLG